MKYDSQSSELEECKYPQNFPSILHSIVPQKKKRPGRPANPNKRPGPGRPSQNSSWVSEQKAAKQEERLIQ